ncbi:hypothetical protein B0H15DRAFT_854353 [Mycena belliarum]|uniref:Uncharacterized protein n=1 Tax=Mycena belliarum TaxID=1033014 RepID=A0AAD6XMJ0_9AGAR|nr:hypothetical protein B0H15DRAFT_854353 [Mycena belliae]
MAIVVGVVGLWIVGQTPVVRLINLFGKEFSGRGFVSGCALCRKNPEPVRTPFNRLHGVLWSKYFCGLHLIGEVINQSGPNPRRGFQAIYQT